MISQNKIRIAMWSGPRNISTAMMRSFENREDTFVVDEPFYAYYLSHSGLDHPGKQEVLKSQSTNWDEVVKLITGDIPDKKFIWYQKHMVHHIANEKDIDWLKNFHNCFLIRHPKEVIISYAKQAPINEITDLGFIQQVDLFKKILALTGKTLDGKNSIFAKIGTHFIENNLVDECIKKILNLKKYTKFDIDFILKEYDKKTKTYPSLERESLDISKHFNKKFYCTI